MIDFQQIVQELIRSGMSQSEIARLVGTTQPTINRICAGATKEPRLNTALALKALFDETKKAA